MDVLKTIITVFLISCCLAACSGFNEITIEKLEVNNVAASEKQPAVSFEQHCDSAKTTDTLGEALRENQVGVNTDDAASALIP